MNDSRPLIAHIVFRFDYGGLENGVVNIVNGLADNEFRHAIIALSEATEFRKRLSGQVPVYALGKRPGKDLRAYWRLYRLFRKLQPAIVHTRNLGTLDCAFFAFIARVPMRIHGEHGWDVHDPDGRGRKFRWIRRLLSSFVNQYVTVSKELQQWLTATVGIAESKVVRICNGVDIDRFRPAANSERDILPADRFDRDSLVVGCVSRFSAIKDPMNLVEAYIRLKKDTDSSDCCLRLLMVGDGELHGGALARLDESGYADSAWLPGSRDDIPELMRAMSIFVLGSLREGISNTVLEAMASGLPIIATATGGNVELVTPGKDGDLVSPANVQQLAEAIAMYVKDRELIAEHGKHARERAVKHYSLNSMIESYRVIYQKAAAARGVA